MTRNYWQRIDMLRHLTMAMVLFDSVHALCEGNADPDWQDVVSATLDDKLMRDVERDMIRLATRAAMLRDKYAQRAEKEAELLAAEWPRIRAAKAAAKGLAKPRPR